MSLYSKDPKEEHEWFLRRFLEQIVEEDSQVYKEYIDLRIRETIKYIKGETNLYTIKRDCFDVVLEWEYYKDIFSKIDLDNIRKIDYVRIRNIYEPKYKSRIAVIEDLLSDNDSE